MSQKLDSLSKIAIALGQINYMAISIDSVNEQMKFIPDKEGFHKDGIVARDKMLASVVKDLSKIMEKMGNLIDGQDAICTADARVAKVPFEIVVLGMDDCDKKYDEEEQDALQNKAR